VSVHADLADQVDVRIIYRPFELDPAAPESGVNIKAKLLEKHGVSAEQVFPGINARARESGIPLELERQPFAYPTAAAHTLVRHAAAKGTTRALSRAIAEAYFLDAVSIADPAILAKLALQHGFVREEVLALLSDAGELSQTRAEARQAMQRGVRSVPTIIIGGAHAMSSSQPVAELRKALVDHAC
jgi:predicted DsbA family dithiol-disulfide isomerase